MKLPEMFTPLFRNYQIDTIDPGKHIDLIVKTALVHGAWDHILWLFEYYGADRIGKVFLDDFYGMRELPEPVVNLWGLLFLNDTDYWMERKAQESKVRTVRGRRTIVPPEDYETIVVGDRREPTVDPLSKEWGNYITLLWQLRKDKAFIPRGIYRFNTFEEVSRWNDRMILGEKPTVEYRPRTI